MSTEVESTGAVDNSSHKFDMIDKKFNIGNGSQGVNPTMRLKVTLLILMLEFILHIYLYTSNFI